MAKIPVIFRKTRTVESIPVRDSLSIDDFPAGRAKSEVEPSKETVLTSNMTGQVTLAGSSFDLLFNKGHLREISGKKDRHRLQLRSRAYFVTTKGRFDYRNESAFALDTEGDYGLRSLQVSRNGGLTGRVITDFFFNRESGNCFIICTVEYPALEEGETVITSAPLELGLAFGGTATVSPETGGKAEEFQGPGGERIIEGKSFGINAGGRLLRLSHVQGYNSNGFSELNGLSVSCIRRRRKKYLLLNPGGSYSPAPAGFYSGVRERFCIRLDPVLSA